MKIINKESLIENYKFLIEKDRRIVEGVNNKIQIINDNSEIKLDLICELIEYLENDEFLDGLIIDEYKNRVKVSIINDYHLMNCTKSVLWFYMDSPSYKNNIQEHIEEFFKIEVKGKGINEIISNVLKELYKINFYYVEPLYDVGKETFSYDLHLFKNTVSLKSLESYFKKKHDKIYKSVSNFRNSKNQHLSLDIKSKGFDKTTKIDSDFFDSCFYNEKYPELNKEFINLILDADDLEAYSKTLFVFFKDDLANIGIFKEEELYKHYKVIKDFEKEFFTGSKLKISNLFLFKDPIEVQFETDMKYPYRFLSFNVSLDSSFDDIKNGFIHNSNNKKIGDVKVKDWLENENEVRELIRLLDY